MLELQAVMDSGSFLNTPWHPFLAHAPLFCSLAWIIFDFLSFLKDKRRSSLSSIWCLTTVTATAFAFASGWLEQQQLPELPAMHQNAVAAHYLWARISLAVMVLTGILVLIANASSNRWIVALSIVSQLLVLAVLGNTARHGGSLVFRYGIGVLP